MNKIVFTSQNDATMRGLAVTLKFLGEDVVIWDMENKPAFDLLYELNPDYLFISNSQIKPDLIEALGEYKKTKVILQGEYVHPGLNIICLLTGPDIDAIMLNNISADIPRYSLKIAANYAEFRNGIKSTKLETDIGYLTSPTDNLPLNIVRSLQNRDDKFKMIGPKHMEGYSYLGHASHATYVNFGYSVKVMIDYNMGNLFNYAANKIFTISNMGADIFPSFNSEEQLNEHLDKYLGDPKARYEAAQFAYKKVIDKDTYFHRIYEIGKLVQEPQWKNSIKTLTSIRQ